MAFTPVTNTIEMVIEATQWGQMRRTVLHAVCPATVTDPDVDAAVEAVATWLGATDTLALFHHSVTFQGVSGKDISVAGGYQTYFNMANVAGGAGYDPGTPGNVALVVSLHTAHPGRSGRGRIFHYGIPGNALSNTDAGQLASGYVGSVNSVYDNLVSAFDAITPKLAVASRKLGIAYTVITSTVDSNVDSQRRRLNGRGR